MRESGIRQAIVHMNSNTNNTSREKNIDLEKEPKFNVFHETASVTIFKCVSSLR